MFQPATSFPQQFWHSFPKAYSFEVKGPMRKWIHKGLFSMQEATRVELEHPNRDLSGIFRFHYNLRPVVPALLYLVVYAGFEWGTRVSGLSRTLNDFSLTAGLNLGLLLVYGIWYAPMVVLATVMDGLWMHPLQFEVTVSLAYCLVISLIEIAAAVSLRHLVSGTSITLKRGWEITTFIVVGFLSSVALAAASTAHLLLVEPIPWNKIFTGLHIDLVSFAIGIFFITPALVIHAGPLLETVLFGINTEKLALSGRQQLLRMNRQGTMFAISFVALVMLAIWLIFSSPTPERLSVFILLSAPLIWVALRRGLEGLSIAAPLLALSFLATLLQFDVAADVSNELLTILLVATLNAYMIAVGVTRSMMTDWQMVRRNAILDAVSYAARQFLGNTGWETGVREVIRRLGEATSVTRVFLTDNRTPNLGGQVGDTYLYEWVTPSLSTAETDGRVLNLLRSQIIEELSEKLSAGQPYLFRTKDFDRRRQEMLETLGIRSGVIIPMFVDGQWWGCLGLEQCFVNRDWPNSEIEGLKMAGQILGTLIASVRVEQQFRQLTGNIHAVFWISAPDGRAKQYVSPGYEEVWGRTCASLQRDPGSWLEGLHHEDQQRVTAALVRQVWGEYDEEYRVERPDGSLRWIHDRAFPVRDQTGKVDRIVGIAEDITKQKEAEEQLRAATVLLSSLIDHLYSGVVVEDEARRITHVNQAFNDIFNVPVSPESLFGVDSRLLFIQTAKFADRIEQIIKAGTPVLGEELEWQGRIFLRNYVPLLINENNRYHLWQYQDVTDSRQAEEQIKSSLKEKEVLLKEIHHRVKNNLQIISSLLNLQSAEIEDPQASQKFRESQDRVKAMALIHERLYKSSDLAKIDFAGYVRNLTGHLVRSYKVNANAIHLKLEVDPVPMNLDVAIPCGLIINELVSNAFKYAFPKGESGEITVYFAEQNHQELKLVVRDSGAGFPPNVDPEDSDSLGLKLVRSLTEQLGGNISYRNQNGFACEIIIPCAKA
jgi:PAS domain S-box-containing protein